MLADVMGPTKQITIVLGIIRNREGHFLLGRRCEPTSPTLNGKWNLLGGKIEFGETPEMAVVREVREESGLEVRVIRLLPQVFVRRRSRPNGEQIDVIELPYECEIVGGQLFESSHDPAVSALKFIQPEEVMNHDLIEGESEIFSLLLPNHSRQFKTAKNFA